MECVQRAGHYAGGGNQTRFGEKQNDDAQNGRHEAGIDRMFAAARMRTFGFSIGVLEANEKGQKRGAGSQA